MKKYFVLLLMGFFGSYVTAQSISSYVVSSAGKSSEAGGLSISWTLGEIAIETLTDNSNTIILTQGFQQGYFEITSIGEPLSNDFNLKLYPNPASDFIWVELDSDDINETIIEIYDLNGKLMYNNKYILTEGPNQIDLTNLNSSQYILRVIDNSGIVLQSYKLIKR